MALRLADLSPSRLARDIGRSFEAHAALRAAHAVEGMAVHEAQGGMAVRGRPQTQMSGEAVGGVPGYLNMMSPQNGDALPAADKRTFADRNEWMQAAVNYVKGRIASADWDIVPLDPKAPADQGVRMKVLKLLKDNPNPKMDSWASFIEPIIADVMILGKGGFEHVVNFRGWPLALYGFDAANMAVDGAWDGSDPKKPRYYWSEPRSFKKKPLRNDQITLMILNPATHRPEGWSYVDALKNTIEGDMAGSAYVRSLMKKYPPPGWLHLGERASQKQIDAANEQLRTNVWGKGGFLVTGMGGQGQKYEPLTNGSGRDNELMAWSRWFAHKVAIVCGLMPQDLGLTEDVNKGNGQVQADLSTEGGVKGMMYRVECYINAEVVGRYGDRRKLNLGLRFKELTLRDRARLAEMAARMNGGTPVVMMNEARALIQAEPLELGNAIYAPSPNGPVAVIGPDADEYRQRLADFAAKQQAALGASGIVSGGEAAGGEGNKQAGSDRAKAASASPAARARVPMKTLDTYPEAGPALTTLAARLRGARARAMEARTAYRRLATQLGLHASHAEEAEEAAYVAERLALGTAAALASWVGDLYAARGAPLGDAVADAWAATAFERITALGEKAADALYPLLHLEAQAVMLLVELADDVALDVLGRLAQDALLRDPWSMHAAVEGTGEGVG